MACPECGGFVTYGSKETIKGYEPCEAGIWVYFPAECEDCGWKGTGRMLYRCGEDDGDMIYEDDVEML